MAEQVAAGILPQAVLDEMLAASKPTVEMPDWYPILRAARYLGVPPWDLAGVPDSAGCQVWVYWALAAERGEAQAETELRQRAERRRG